MTQWEKDFGSIHNEKIMDANDISNFMKSILKNKTHGGKRNGSGRPKKEKTVVMRVPKSKVKLVKKIIANT